MVASKKAITKCWLQRNPPTRRLLTNIINSIQAMENLTFALWLQKDKVEEYWEKWDRYKLRLLIIFHCIPMWGYICIVYCTCAFLICTYFQMSNVMSLPSSVCLFLVLCSFKTKNKWKKQKTEHKRYVQHYGKAVDSSFGPAVRNRQLLLKTLPQPMKVGSTGCLDALCNEKKK